MPSSPQSEGSPREAPTETSDTRSSIDEGRRASAGEPTARLTRKRGREGSTEPGHLAASSSAASIAAKKSKTVKQPLLSPPDHQDSTDDIDRPHTRASGSTSRREACNVGEVRKKVEAMTHRDGTPGIEETSEVMELSPTEGQAGKTDQSEDDASQMHDGPDNSNEAGQEAVTMQLEGKRSDAGSVMDADVQASNEGQGGEVIGDRSPSRKSMISNSSRPETPVSGMRPDTPEPRIKDSNGLAGAEGGHQSDGMDDSGSAQSVSPRDDGAIAATQHGTKRKMVARTPSSLPIDGTEEGAKKLKESDNAAGLKPPTSATPSHDMENPPKSATPSTISVDMDAAQSATSNGDASTSAAETEEKAAGIPPPTATPAKKPQATFGSFAAKASPFAAAKPASGSLFGSASSSSDFTAKAAAAVKEANGLDPAVTPKAVASAPAVKKPQATFGSFSSSSSPFASTGLKHTSAFGAPTGGPSSLASAHSGSPMSKAGSNAFSGWGKSSAAKSAWDSPAAKSPIKGNGGEHEAKEASGEKDETKVSEKPESFVDMLTKKDDVVEDTVKKMDMEEQQSHTGEEDEQTLHQVRTKLYVMEANGGWKERGTGSVHLNVRLSDGGGPRLVMRAEGVFRLILNVNLFPGMFSELTEKYLKLVAMEDGASRSFLMKFGTAKAAIELQSKMAEFIAGEAGKRSRESPKSGGSAADALV